MTKWDNRPSQMGQTLQLNWTNAMTKWDNPLTEIKQRLNIDYLQRSLQGKFLKDKKKPVYLSTHRQFLKLFNARP